MVSPWGGQCFQHRVSFFLSISSKVFSPSDELFPLTWVLSKTVSRVTLSWLHREKYSELVHCLVLRFHRILLSRVSNHFLNLFHFCTFLLLEVAFTVALGNFPQTSKELYNSTRVPGERRSLRCGCWGTVQQSHVMAEWLASKHQPQDKYFSSFISQKYMQSTHFRHASSCNNNRSGNPEETMIFWISFLFPFLSSAVLGRVVTTSIWILETLKWHLSKEPSAVCSVCSVKSSMSTGNLENSLPER